MQRTTLGVCLCAWLVAACWAQQAAQLLQNPCSSKTTCGDCVRAASCAWCFAREFNGPRCFNPAAEGGLAGCDEAFIFNPDNQLYTDTAFNRELSRVRVRTSSSSSSSTYEERGAGGAGGAMTTGGAGENLVQIKPQRVSLQLRMNQMMKLKFYYSRAQNYKLDLMNLSRSMKNDQEIQAIEIYDFASNAVQIDYYSSCLGSKDNVIKTNKCDGLRVGDVVEFTAEITLKECPLSLSLDRREWRETFLIYPGLTVELDMICDCPCEHPGHHAYDDSALVCSGHGVSACGVCMCAPGRFGKSCECSAHGGGSVEQERGCRPTNASAGPLCSNRGNCICGVCECSKMADPSEIISGPFCECDNFSCDRYRGQICSGPDHGECVCGYCNCRPEYTGPACNCLKDDTPCRSPDSGEICNGNGRCICGKCVCDVNGENPFSGKFCDKCPTCPGRCKEFKECVLCSVHNRGAEWNDNGTCTQSCAPPIQAMPVVVEGQLEANESKNEHLCSFQDEEDDCLYVFVYSYDDRQNLLIQAQKKRQCPKKGVNSGSLLERIV